MLIGLTGGVGSGKSMVAHEFERLGAIIIDADLIAREVTVKDTPVYSALVEEFGEKILNHEDLSIDRRALGREVFSNINKLQRLNDITHPEIRRLIMERIEKFKQEQPSSIIIVSVPLLYETSLNESMDKVIVVNAARYQQIERIKKRDDLSEYEARDRVDAQMPLKEKVALADIVIQNKSDLEDTLIEARNVFQKLQHLR